jgi:hypothetical protein
MRIVTWNMVYWGHDGAHEAPWRWLLGSCRPVLAPRFKLIQSSRIFEYSGYGYQELSLSAASISWSSSAENKYGTSRTLD